MAPNRAAPLPLYVLVGGRSERFGRPKAIEPVEGKPLALRVVDALADAGRATLVGAGAAALDGLGLRRILDGVPASGPIGGLRAALIDVGAGWIVLAPCDVVGLRAPWLEVLATARVPGARAVAFRGERWEPLPSLWHTDALGAVDQALADGTGALHRLLAACDAVALPLPLDWDTAVRVTTPADLPAATACLARLAAEAAALQQVAVGRQPVPSTPGQRAPLEHATDSVAVEAPLEVHVVWRGGRLEESAPLTVTMRTPGDDADLARGLVLGERVVLGPADIESVQVVADGVVSVRLVDGVVPRMAATARVLPASGACGVCGKASRQAVEASVDLRRLEDAVRLDPARVGGMLAQMRAHQRAFDATGGVHAAALFGADGNLIAVREDIGRHNAIDKVVGCAARQGRFPAHGCVLLTSGRAGFEIVQKALAARIPIVVAVGAPSSLAVELATTAGLTLLAFARGGGFSVYAGSERIADVT
ncbi:MAG: formate dehydrogenase accessory sulfurtransferase FdhD [Myxococcales bacterium]|nr:formate dehydrogenase accessory sulfurtransferase FdhD [Myxococcales bacterium]